MASTKIPSPASVRRALTTLRRYGAIDNIDVDYNPTEAYILLKIDKTLLSSKKTSRKKPKHKKVIPEKFSGDSSEKMTVDCTLPDNSTRG